MNGLPLLLQKLEVADERSASEVNGRLLYTYSNHTSDQRMTMFYHFDSYRSLIMFLGLRRFTILSFVLLLFYFQLLFSFVIVYFSKSFFFLVWEGGILKSHKNLRVLMRHCQKWLYKKFTSSPSSRWNYNRLSYIARQTRNKFSIGHGEFSSVTWGKCTSSRQIYFVYQ